MAQPAAVAGGQVAPDLVVGAGDGGAAGAGAARVGAWRGVGTLVATVGSLLAVVEEMVLLDMKDVWGCTVGGLARLTDIDGVACG